MKLATTISMIIAISTVPLMVNADDDSFSSWLFGVDRKKKIAPADDATYLEECGACHFPYQPGLLPEASWKKVMKASALEDHFTENAELDEETRIHIEHYLITNSADKSRYKRSRKIMASLKSGEAPMRITEVPYIIEKHDEIPQKLIKDNDKVKALSFCDKCHQDAQSGNFEEDSVKIPGHGHWSD